MGFKKDKRMAFPFSFKVGDREYSLMLRMFPLLLLCPVSARELQQTPS